MKDRTVEIEGLKSTIREWTRTYALAIRERDAAAARACALANALEKTAGALACRGMPPGTRVAFTGRWAHLGTLTIDAVIEDANAALEAAKPIRAQVAGAAACEAGGSVERSTG